MVIDDEWKFVRVAKAIEYEMERLASFGVLCKLAGGSSKAGDSREMKREGCDRRLLMGDGKYEEKDGGRDVIG